MRNKEILDFAVTTAQEAGTIVMRYFGTELTRSIKRNKDDFATEADIAAEKYILAEIRTNFPSDAIVAEESGRHGATESDYTWLVDPLDGTYQFSESRDNFGVMLVRAYRDTLELAVVFNPARGTLATTMKGSGTLLNGKRVELNKMDDLEDKPLSVEKDNQEKLKGIGYSVTNLGASANTLVTLAGERRAYVSSNGAVWDWAPAALLLAEAGFKVTDFARRSFNWQRSQGVIAAPPSLHEEILLILKS